MEDIRPDRGFMGQLRLLDKRLGIKFNGSHFVLTFTTQRHGEVSMWTVVDERGGGRQPDQRELEMLRESDMERLGPEQRWNLTQAYMAKFQEDRKREVREELRNRTKDDKIQLAKAFARVVGNSKGNSAFRRI